MQAEHAVVWRGLLAPPRCVELDAAVRKATIRLLRERRLKSPDALTAASAA